MRLLNKEKNKIIFFIQKSLNLNKKLFYNLNIFRPASYIKDDFVKIYF